MTNDNIKSIPLPVISLVSLAKAVTVGLGAGVCAAISGGNLTAVIEPAMLLLGGLSLLNAARTIWRRRHICTKRAVAVCIESEPGERLLWRFCANGNLSTAHEPRCESLFVPHVGDRSILYYDPDHPTRTMRVDRKLLALRVLAGLALMIPFAI